MVERLKDAIRHCYTRNGRHERVAEHSWLTTLMAFFMKDEFPDVDMDKVIKMCIIHDWGEAFTGDIPAFEKTVANEETEEKLLYDEMSKRETVESKICKAIAGLEAVIQHNILALSTWIPKSMSGIKPMR